MPYQVTDAAIHSFIMWSKAYGGIVFNVHRKVDDCVFTHDFSAISCDIVYMPIDFIVKVNVTEQDCCRVMALMPLISLVIVRAVL